MVFSKYAVERLKNVITRALAEQQRRVVDVRHVENPVRVAVRRIRRRDCDIKIDNAVRDRLAVNQHVVSVLIHKRLGERQFNPLREPRTRVAEAASTHVDENRVHRRRLVVVDQVE